MPELQYLREQTGIVGIGETVDTRGTPQSALELALEASLSAIEDAGIAPDDLQIGMPVELWFDNVSKEVTLPKFKRAAER